MIIRDETSERDLGIDVREATSVLARMRGLMFTSRLKGGEGLVLRPCSSIQMCFMRYSIDAVFFDRDGRVTRVAKKVRPWIGIAFGGRGAVGVVELPVGAAENTEVGNILRFWVPGRLKEIGPENQHRTSKREIGPVAVGPPPSSHGQQHDRRKAGCQDAEKHRLKKPGPADKNPQQEDHLGIADTEGRAAGTGSRPDGRSEQDHQSTHSESKSGSVKGVPHVAVGPDEHRAKRQQHGRVNQTVRDPPPLEIGAGKGCQHADNHSRCRRRREAVVVRSKGNHERRGKGGREGRPHEQRLFSAERRRAVLVLPVQEMLVARSCPTDG